MLTWVNALLFVAAIAGVVASGGIAGATLELAKLFVFFAVIMFLVSAVVGLARGRMRV